MNSALIVLLLIAGAIASIYFAFKLIDRFFGWVNDLLRKRENKRSSGSYTRVDEKCPRDSRHHMCWHRTNIDPDGHSETYQECDSSARSYGSYQCRYR